MILLELLIFLVIAGVVGSVARFIVGFGRGGFLIAVLVGLVGALIGTWLAARPIQAIPAGPVGAARSGLADRSWRQADRSLPSR
jgi:uncharacterized membrane protein YeaQ/YmgE (transglycosylase-associated protein family)